MTLRRLRLLTAGESHGPGLSGILEGLPADLRVSTAKVDKELARRQHGYGSGRRMQIERDRVQWTAGLRFGRTLGSPLAFSIPNRDWDNWAERMSVEPTGASRRPRPITLARPGHADLAGAIKYDTGDIRNVLERASARSTAPRVAAGAVCRQVLEACGVRVWSFVDQLGPVLAFGGVDEPAAHVPDGWVEADRREPTPLRCPDPVAEAAMMAEVDAAIEAGDSVGGSFVVVAEGMPVGIGSNSEWDTRIDAAVAEALMGIQAVKGVEIGIGFGAVSKRGSAVHDEVRPGAPSWERKTNRAGGTEGGMTNGAAIVARVAVKPVATLRKPLDSVDLASGEVRRAHIERSDVAIIPRAAIVGEAMLAIALADALLADMGGDTIGDVKAAVRRRRRRSAGPRGAGAAGTLEALPDNAAEEATVVEGTDA
jgi:chorismate synthase